MSAYKRIPSPNGKAELIWKRGIMRDSISLLVNNEIVEEEGDFGISWPFTRTIRLNGHGYMATITIGWERLFFSTVLNCNFSEPSGYNSNSQHPASHTEMSIDVALRELDISDRFASWDSIESSFRHLMKMYHPDTYASQNLPPEMIDAASKRFYKINESYNFLKLQKEL